jgi:3-(3-hydroxy-phenyl)propionate hydroxylase
MAKPKTIDGIPVWRLMQRTPAPKSAREAAPIVIAGAGPVGLALALDLGRRGRRVIVVTALDFIARGSRAICFSKRSLEIFDRLGVGARVREKGVRWEKGKVFWKDLPEPIYEFDLLPVKAQKNPAFVNIQQYYVEEYLIDEIAKHPSIEIRWGHRITGVRQTDSAATMSVSAKDGDYEISADFVAACDGVRSTIRKSMGLDFEGRIFEDNFLIADVRLASERPAERHFHFDPPWPGWSSLVHKQPDNVWRLDFQLGWDIDREAAVRPENVDPFVKGMLGPGVDYDYEWLSVYTFQCRRMARFLHGRIIFLGDAAQVVSPFGARGCNGGLQQADNRGWKLDRVLSGVDSPSLLESFNAEAVAIADENIRNSSRSTDFMTPKTKTAKLFRDATLELARQHAFARPFVNSGRLSAPVAYRDSPLSSPSDEFAAGPAPGAVAVDAPVRVEAGEPWLLSHLGGGFSLLLFGAAAALRVEMQRRVGEIVRTLTVGSRNAMIIDEEGFAAERYGAEGGAVYLVRPDQHIAARWKNPAPETIFAALARAGGGAG